MEAMNIKIYKIFLVCFIFQSCATFSKEYHELEIYKLYGINTIYNKKYIRNYKISGKYYYDLNEESLIFLSQDNYNYGPLEEEFVRDYIESNPIIKYQYTPSDLCTFSFTKRDDGYFYLTKIENLNYEKLLSIKEKIDAENLILFKENFYKKKSNSIQDKVIRLNYANSSFRMKNPYGFSKDCYYSYTDKNAQIIQWVDEKSCIVNFAPLMNSINEAFAYVEFDNSISKNPALNSLHVLYHYEGVYSYVTTLGNTNVLPKFKIIFSEDEIRKSLEKINGNKVSATEYISSSSKFLIENTPYGLNKETIYKDSDYVQPKILLQLHDGCLLDYNNPRVPGIYWDCLVFVVLTENERHLLFSQDYEHYYKYVGVYEYTGTDGKNTVPMFKAYFSRK